MNDRSSTVDQVSESVWKTEATLSGTCESRSARAKLTTDLSTRYIHLTVLFTLLCLHPRLRIRLSISIIIIADRRVKNKPTNYTVLFSIVLHVHSTPFFVRYII